MGNGFEFLPKGVQRLVKNWRISSGNSVKSCGRIIRMRKSDDDFEPLIDGLINTFGDMPEEKRETSIVNLFTDDKNRLQ